MAEKIAKYEAKDLAIKPSNVGYSAAEMAGRRIGPFATQAADAIKQVANLQAEYLKDTGAQQTSFARLEGLEHQGEGVAVKYGGGLKDMFQLGAGGNEPNYARLNRLADLQNGPVNIAAAARHIVRAQSPLNTTSPSTAWNPMNASVQYGKGGVTPTPDTTDEQASDAGFNMGGNPTSGPSAAGIMGWDTSGSNLTPELARVQAGGPETTPAEVAGSGATDVQPWQTQPDPPLANSPLAGPVDTSGDQNANQWPSASAPVQNADGSPYVPTATDPSQNANAPPVWGNLLSGMSDPSDAAIQNAGF